MNHTENQADTHQATNTSFSFHLHLSRIEKSKDSHSSNEVWRLDNHELAYQRTFTGRAGKRLPEKSTRTLTEDELASLYKVIQEGNLEQNVEMPKHSEFVVPYTAVRITWELKKDNQNFRIQIYDHANQIGEDKNYQSLQKIIRLLKK